jgi:hypothetical protein
MAENLEIIGAAIADMNESSPLGRQTHVINDTAPHVGFAFPLLATKRINSLHLLQGARVQILGRDTDDLFAFRGDDQSRVQVESPPLRASHSSHARQLAIPTEVDLRGVVDHEPHARRNRSR